MKKKEEAKTERINRIASLLLLFSFPFIGTTPTYRHLQFVRRERHERNGNVQE